MKYTEEDVHARRDLLEREMMHDTSRAVVELLADVERAAFEEIETYAPHTLTAAGAPSKRVIMALSVAGVAAAWGSVVVPRILEHAREMGLGDDYLRQAQERLTSSSLPTEIADAAAAVLTRGAEEHQPKAWFTSELAKVLTPAEWSGKTERVVRMEATLGFNAATLNTLAKEGIKRKRWVTERDDRVRSDHRRVEGQVRTLSTPFLVGGYAMMMPGDPSAPLSETAGCRCVIVGAR